jgi:ABC-type tungstate transport system substrate-binding protein
MNALFAMIMFQTLYAFPVVIMYFANYAQMVSWRLQKSAQFVGKLVVRSSGLTNEIIL